MTDDKFETYDFLINEEDEAMLLLYVREGEPKDSTIELDIENKSAILTRCENDTIEIQNIPDDVFDSIQESDKLMVCELSMEESEDDTEIVYAYEAEIRD